MEQPKDVTNKPCKDCGYHYAYTNKTETFWTCERCGYQYFSADITDDKKPFEKFGMGAVLMISDAGIIQNSTYNDKKFFDELALILSDNSHITKVFYSEFREDNKFYWVNWFTKQAIEFHDYDMINNKDGTFFPPESPANEQKDEKK